MAVLSVVFFFLFNLQVAAVYARIWPLIFPLVAAVAFGGIWYFLRQGKEFYAFAASSVMIAFSMFTVAIGLFPNLLLSTTNPESSILLSEP